MKALICLSLVGAALVAQMTIQEYSPKSTLVVPEHPITRAKFPFIDIHGHQNTMMPQDKLDALVKEMDSLNLQTMVNLSGGFGPKFREGIKNMKARHGKRFAVFCNLDLTNLDDPGYAQRAATTLEEDIKAGCQGVKFFKQFGMNTKDGKGVRIAVTDARFEPSFRVIAKHKLMVLIHTADPKPFWDPVDKFNEKYQELTEIPSRRKDPAKDGSWETLMDEAYTLFKRHRDINFVQAHLGWLGGDLGKLGRMFDEMPNMHCDIAAVIYEFGRQPKFARQFCTKYQDRLFMGKDTWAVREFDTYFRVLESGDEYFEYYRKRHAFWRMYGLELPDEVLKKIYYKNSLRLIPTIDAKQFPK